MCYKAQCYFGLNTVFFFCSDLGAIFLVRTEIARTDVCMFGTIGGMIFKFSWQSENFQARFGPKLRYHHKEPILSTKEGGNKWYFLWAQVQCCPISYNPLSLCDLWVRAKLIAEFIGGNRVRSEFYHVFSIVNFLCMLRDSKNKEIIQYIYSNCFIVTVVYADTNIKMKIWTCRNL